MSDSQEYTLRWRGRPSGPYPVAEINRMLDDHEIGMGHEIFYQDEWITLEEFLAALRKAAAPAAPPQRPALPTIALAPLVGTMSGEKVSPVRIKVSVTPVAEGARGADRAGAGQDRPRYRLVFAFLAVLAGYSGAHNFYAREWLTGLLQLLLSVATYLMGFGIVASWLWAMVEAVVVRRDGHGADMI
jgi:TM2 domain-containing membrane protein YozV